MVTGEDKIEGRRRRKEIAKTPASSEPPRVRARRMGRCAHLSQTICNFTQDSCSNTSPAASMCLSYLSSSLHGSNEQAAGHEVRGWRSVIRQDADFENQIRRFLALLFLVVKHTATIYHLPHCKSAVSSVVLNTFISSPPSLPVTVFILKNSICRKLSSFVKY